MEQRIIEIFHQSIEAKMSAGEGLAPIIAMASTHCCNQLLQGYKLLCAGNGTSASMANILTENLMHQHKLERPGLPTISLHCDSSLLSGISSSQGINETFSRQVRTLGQPGDTLVCFSSGEDPANLCQAIQAAHSRSMTVICFTGLNDQNIRSLLGDQDIEIMVPVEDVHRCQEVQLLSLFSLCELIDQQIFGGM